MVNMSIKPTTVLSKVDRIKNLFVTTYKKIYINIYNEN